MLIHRARLHVLLGWMMEDWYPLDKTVTPKYGTSLLLKLLPLSGFLLPWICTAGNHITKLYRAMKNMKLLNLLQISAERYAKELLFFT
jgi:hypothetical protein